MQASSPKRILIIDEDERTRLLLKRYLEKEGYIVNEATHGLQAIQQFYSHSFSIIVMEWALPDVSGSEVCRHVKHNSSVPILVLTGKTDVNDRIQGFEAGADDYVLKPFSAREVILRIRSILDRFEGNCSFKLNTLSASEILISGIVIQPAARRVLVDEQEVHLTPKEYDLLYLLAAHPGKVFSREELLQQVWKASHASFDHRTVDTHIKRLRHKLSAKLAGGEELIQTLWGIGYVLRVAE
ncbi:Transcriptional regulatory protein SrrA [compost metagenome]